MKLLLGIVLIGLIVQLPTHNPQQPGNPGHRPPPTDFYCETHHTDPAHRCECYRVDMSELCEGEPVEDNTRCLVACHKNHCHCQVHCAPPTKAPP